MDDEKKEFKLEVSQHKVDLQVTQQPVSSLYGETLQVPLVAISGQIRFSDQTAAERAFNMSLSTDEEARCLHRVVRAMHDGNCPACGTLAHADLFYRRPMQLESTGKTMVLKASDEQPYHQCPNPDCRFTITAEESKAALEQFRDIMRRNCEVFLQWRERRKQAAAQPQPASATE